MPIKSEEWDLRDCQVAAKIVANAWCRPCTREKKGRKGKKSEKKRREMEYVGVIINKLSMVGLGLSLNVYSSTQTNVKYFFPELNIILARYD